jgi:ectoine hydroxylase-related dioxygenase (phytanoyl-CoA dioxygenase family)
MPTFLRTSPWIGAAECDLDEFRAQLRLSTDAADYPHAHDIRDSVPVYRSGAMARADRRALQAELIAVLTDGPGVLVIEGAFCPDVVDEASDALVALIAAQGRTRGDHFGRAGANDRLWNAAQKLALAAPRVYAEYYANDSLALVCQAWLGPRYTVTSQVNVVNPGGTQQVPHRDYHLGFVPTDHLTHYPAHVHRCSPMLTLQGAVAHCDMPTESGPTMLLPYSQTFAGGYVAFNRPEFIDFFAEHHVQVPLRKGDAVFFNPALYHGAGANTSTDIRRMANLLQVSSPFGRPMEALDHDAMVRAVYPALLAMKAAGSSPQELINAVVATADGYAFPTNLDRDAPAGDLSPPSQVDIVLAALADELTDEALDATLRAAEERRIP